ncbi:hypothetical protein BABINDRAFT_35509 [Babjeviella inositovora NRRL Y-12698]|uniref:Diphthamide biosynthesis protein 4 n=1 Tax=Babjeviella inositovora NRRL Y-12698 TaxID=984486 RepID=A0A1E3QTS8_9ASCO|nr:uncharacterized protein BABINDRAFT_35509 [Babjeviella inositovora NRRL Y-12698]ODQ80422.1 hypothetical protein BABINDRAFT_35509 [Babjeviella inositovora NRRL Y-12698]
MKVVNLRKTHYEVMGVAPDAPASEIKAAYRTRLLLTHPDKLNQRETPSKVDASQEIAELKEAYAVLLHPEERAQYDRDLQKSVQRFGFNLNGDGLDMYTLEDFTVHEPKGDEAYFWTKDCPRCTGHGGFVLTEGDLESSGTDDGEGGFDLIVQCNMCSLWLKVKYFEEEE